MTEAEIRVLEGPALLDVMSGRWLTDFGTIDTDVSAAQYFTIHNIGLDDLHLELQDPVVVLYDTELRDRLEAAYGIDTVYTAVWDSSPDQSTTVAPGESTTLTVTLESPRPGRFAGSLLLDTNDLDEDPFEISLTGLVRAATIQTSDEAIIAEDEPTDRTEFEADRPFRYLRRDTRYLDNDVWYSRQAGALATWTIHNVDPDTAYQISATWAGGETAATNAPFFVYANGLPMLDVRVDQTRPSGDFEDGGAMWEVLGQIVTPTGADTLTIVLSDDADGFVLADAVHVVPLATGEIVASVIDPDTGTEADLTDEQSVVDFGYTELFPDDADRARRTFTIVNQGASALTLIEPITMPLGFTLEQSFGSTALQPNEETTFVVSVDAAAPGPLSGELVVESSDLDEGRFEFVLTAQVGVQVRDDGNDGFSSTGFRPAVGPLHVGGDFRYASPGNGSSFADWEFTELTPGRFYAVSATWMPGPGRASNVPFTVFGGAPAAGDDVGTALVDQRLWPDDYQDYNAWWEKLTVVQVPDDETSLTVRMTNAANNWVYADAIRIEQVYLPEADVTRPAPVAGDPAISVESGEGVDFGTMVYLADSTVELTLHNRGVLPMDVYNVNVSGTGFSQTGLGTTQLGEGDSVTFTVAFDTAVTTGAGSYNGELTFNTNDPDETSFSVPLRANLTNRMTSDNDGPGFSFAKGGLL
jgi:hypothetical protein